MEGMKSTTRERTLLRVAKVAQERTTSFDVVGQNPFSKMVRVVCVLMELKRLHRMERTRTVLASKLLSSSKMVSSPPVDSTAAERLDRPEVVLDVV